MAAILDQAGGMFLYASLAWATFRDWNDEWTPRGVKERLKRLKSLASDSEIERPSMVTKDTLYSFYMRILDTLPGDPKRIRKIFMWLVTAHTPMTLAELRVVSAFDPTACFTFLSFKDLINSPAGINSSNEYEDPRLQNECPFLRYAALYWSHHAEKASDSPDALWNRFVSWANSDNLNLGFRIFWHQKGRGEFPRNATPMHIICYQGSGWLLARAFAAQKFLKWVVVDAQDSLGRTPLHWAAITGH